MEIPAFPVHFSAREGFTGPATEVSAEAPAIALNIKRPPGSEDLAYLITTSSFEVSETWQPQPGSAEVGAVFKRTITQRAGQMTGMALAPALAPAPAPAGIRLYPGKPEITDHSERGEFHGERRETLTYLIEEPGTLVLPALAYVWWDPQQQKLESKTLPAVTFEVPPPPPSPAAKASTRSRNLAVSLAALAILAGLVWQRQRLATWTQRVWRKLNPPDRVAARKLLHACRRNDARGAAAAWSSWQNTRPPALKPTPALETAVLGLQRQLFGPSTPATWQGADLATSFSDFLKDPPAPTGISSALPPLNP